jgi:CarD family transcriptional regulator
MSDNDGDQPAQAGAGQRSMAAQVKSAAVAKPVAPKAAAKAAPAKAGAGKADASKAGASKGGASKKAASKPVAKPSGKAAAPEKSGAAQPDVKKSAVKSAPAAKNVITTHAKAAAAAKPVASAKSPLPFVEKKNSVNLSEAKKQQDPIEDASVPVGSAKPASEHASPAPTALSTQPGSAPPQTRPSHGGMMGQNAGLRPMTPPRAMAKAENFVEGDFVVYPTHGVGKVERIAVEDIAGHRLELIHITFDENRMTLRVPVNKARTAGLRKLSSRKQFDDVLATLKGRARIKRTMWSRRAQEYEAKINSGDPQAIAEVVRDLHRNSGQPDQSFSERQIYEAALERLAAEYGALEGKDKQGAIDALIAHLKSE